MRLVVRAAPFAGLMLAVVASISAQLPRHGAAPQIGTSRDQEIALGKVKFEERCAICHYSESTAQKIGPGMKGLYARGKFADDKKVNDLGMTAWIEKGGKDMPGFKDVLKPGETRALIAYLRTL